MTIYNIKNNLNGYTYTISGDKLSIIDIKSLILEKYFINVDIYDVSSNLIVDEYCPLVENNKEYCVDELFLLIKNHNKDISSNQNTKTVTFYKIDNNSIISKVINVPTNISNNEQLNIFLNEINFLEKDKIYNYYLGNETINNDNFNNIFEHTVKIISKN
jgi:hypothetical protein